MINLKGSVLALLTDERGILIGKSLGENLVVSTGLILAAKALANTSYTPLSHMAIGTSSTVAGPSNSALLGTELARVALTSTSRTDNAITYSGSFGPGVGTGTVEEAGILNAASSGEMLCRFLTGTLVKGAGHTLTITWTVTFTG